MGRFQVRSWPGRRIPGPAGNRGQRPATGRVRRFELEPRCSTQPERSSPARDSVASSRVSRVERTSARCRAEFYCTAGKRTTGHIERRLENCAPALKLLYWHLSCVCEWGLINVQQPTPLRSRLGRRSWKTEDVYSIMKST